MTATSANQQASPNILPSPPPKEKQNTKTLILAFGLIFLIGLPLFYVIGYSRGLNAGRATAQFDFYYVKPKQKYGVDDLDNWLKELEWIKPYQENVFDCSEMSAYLEWKLENEGWHTIIVVGNCPFRAGYHGWLLVETSVDQYMPVESTTIAVVWGSDPNFDKYFDYDYSFETIQEALAYSSTEFDWWKS